MTRTEKMLATKAANKASKERIAAACAAASIIVKTGVCPDCGCGMRRNLSITGWWQCGQYGSKGFRKDDDKPACHFQCFTE